MIKFVKIFIQRHRKIGVLLHMFQSILGKLKSRYYKLKYDYILEEMLDDDIYSRRKKDLKSAVENGKKMTYFIIRRSYKGMGLYTYVCVFLSYVAYAIGKGYIPVIDMENYPNIYMKDSDIGKKNAWEFFYKQPFGIGLRDIPEGSKCIYSSALYLPSRTPFITSLLYEKKEYNLYEKIYKDYIFYNSEVQDYTSHEIEKIFRGGGKYWVFYIGELIMLRVNQRDTLYSLP